MKKPFLNRIGAARLATAGLAALLLSGGLAAQATDVVNRWSPPPPASDFGHLYDSLFNRITALTVGSFIIVVIMIACAVWKFRARPGQKAHYDHGTSLHDKRFTAIVSVTVFIVLDAWVLVTAMQDLRGGFYNIPSEDEPGIYRVEVYGQQWSWNFRSPGLDGEFGTPDDIVTINELHVPKDRAVSLNLMSKDVIHALFLPDMRVKRDLNPGAINLAWFRPITAGSYDILCAELCGVSHYQMQGRLHVLGEEAFNAWEREASKMAVIGFDAEDTEAHWAWDWSS